MQIPDQSLPQPFVDVAVQSSASAVREVLHQFLGALDVLSLEPEERATVELVLAEALNNIVEHAYPTCAQSGPIIVKGHHRRDGLHIHITDEGESMPDGQTPLGLPPSVDVDLMDLPEGGFGWFLIKDLAKDVVYARTGDQNSLQLRVAVALH